MYYLESKNLVHRDISYTNILLRSQGKDSTEKQNKRREIMSQLGLSQIESLRESMGCREGLLIDFDYASFLDAETKAGQADASSSNVNESLGEHQFESQDSSQNSSQASCQAESREDFEVVDNDETVVQRVGRKFSSLGPRTVSYF
jgi:serine/threonine protein kinase